MPQGGDLLVCSNWDCPIVVHESCMLSVARFDDSGGFYCPYCLYKESLVECHQAKEKVLLANKALINFLDTRTRIDAEPTKNSRSLKRKKPDAPLIFKNKDGAMVECNEVHQPMQLGGGHLDNSQFLETLSGNQQESRPTRGNCIGKGSPAKNDEKLDNKSNDIGDSGITDKSQVKSSKSSVLPTKEYIMLVTQNPTNEHGQTAKTVLGSLEKGVEREQWQTDPQETPWCMTNSTLEVNEEPCKGNDSALQDGCYVETQVLDTFDRPGETREGFSMTHEECRNTTDVHPMRKERNSFPQRGLGKSTIKHLEIEQTMEIYHDIRDDNAIVITGKPDGICDCAYKDDDPVLRQRIINSGNNSQDAGVGKYQSQRADEERTNLKSPISPACYTKKDNDTVIHEKSGNSNKKIEETSKPVDQYNNGQVEKVQTHEESQKDCYGSAGEIKIQVKALQDDVYTTRENNAAVTHELGILASKHSETKDSLEKNHDRVAKMEQPQTKRRSTRNNDKKEMAEESDVENCSSSHCGMTNDGKTRVNSQNNSPQITRNGSLSVSAEEFGSADESSNTEYLERGSYAVPKRKMQKNLKNDIQHGKFSGISKNEGESRHKVESIKQIQRTTTLPAARRWKLPWTAEEVEMLKEGVQKFSLATNKNISWIKILEFGRHIFDGTRVPTDLKDKWKKIKGEGYANTDAK
ncbi:uncharacterized protein LOC110712020 isoform X1 [Chenopodium quinoa]|uniref:uncharacterized protein LOC110712020 isoform X1 n=1 Tax=Chenopodium quinoa TaxID=63459 RepID=UPI000B7906F6|nr:uncharacterized protein LOC110712020 isoform X1 [Chenopodium quinoa]